MRLTGLLPSSSASERLKACSSLRSLVVVGVLCLVLGADLLKMQPAQATSIDHYKLYAHSRIIEWNEFMCFKDIITKENRRWHEMGGVSTGPVTLYINIIVNLSVGDYFGLETRQSSGGNLYAWGWNFGGVAGGGAGSTFLQCQYLGA